MNSTPCTQENGKLELCAISKNMKVTSERNTVVDGSGFPLSRFLFPAPFFLLWIDAMAVATNSLLPLLSLSHFSLRKNCWETRGKRRRRREGKKKAEFMRLNARARARRTHVVFPSPCSRCCSNHTKRAKDENDHLKRSSLTFCHGKFVPFSRSFIEWKTRNRRADVLEFLLSDFDQC